MTQLQDAFADGQLDDTEFDERMRAALTAKTHADLDMLLKRTSRPAVRARRRGRPRPRTGRGAGRPGRYAIAWKGSVRRAGRWRVPERYTTVVYKGGGVLDLRAAELLSPATTIVAVAYKSEITLLVPPGMRVEMTGFGIAQGPTDTMVLAPDAPVLHVRSLAYKGSIETGSRAGPHRQASASPGTRPGTGVDVTRPQRRGPGVLLDRVRDPTGRAAHREDRLPGTVGHARDGAG